ncbi:L7Ae/L30e/S12e/Gadd45 family ribosomal protein [Fonticella tunisiensis]|uniref:Ribosomal protein L7Ae-like RNA K-turn-binding protein n=1 Tax=Fonticella tunisiensis TaxID=1096341 RepID=A0A4R7KRY4_9CLOT|nr:ribosomal L7Ae/L30e/S12e/Gadd45 family protein [Fonticella tunisiensis]TDT61567.1 ribosomal protein L7Ae-like RNA K-turn-binding protein [Fonticella tunisiensis]
MGNNLYSFIGLMKKSGRLSSGDDAVEYDIKKGKSRLIIIAEDASENTKKRFVDSARYRGIPFVYFGTKEHLGSHIGKSSTAVLSVNDDGFANAFVKKMNDNGGADIVKS